MKPEQFLAGNILYGSINARTSVTVYQYNQRYDTSNMTRRTGVWVWIWRHSNCP